MISWRTALTITISLACPSIVVACNIPVFRYALERWRPDSFEAVVFHDAPLDDAQLAFVDKWRKRSAEMLGRDDGQVEPANFEIILSKNDPAAMPPDVRAVWDLLVAQHKEPPAMPWVVFRAPGDPRKPRIAWQGSLDDARWEAVCDSPVRRELRKRLLAGHAIVWLWLPGTDTDQNQRLTKLLAERLPQLEKEITLPEGIGSDGVDLLTDVPLEIKFSSLAIDPSDPAERTLLEMLKSQVPNFPADGQPVLLPVFGCGRVLDAIPGSDVDGDVLTDAAQFLCAACSCQVKSLNPGFDLILTGDWDRLLSLAGSPASLDPVRAKSSSDPGPPKYVPIPGRTNAAAGIQGQDVSIAPAEGPPPKDDDVSAEPVRLPPAAAKRGDDQREQWPPSVTATMLAAGAVAMIIMLARARQRRRNRRESAEKP